MVLVVKNLPANAGDQEMQVESLGHEDPLEKGMAMVSFVVQKLLSLIRSHLFIFAFISNILGGGS